MASNHPPLTRVNASNYIVAMKTQIIRIGNSQGVRIPKPFLRHSKIEKDVEIEAQENQIVIRASRKPREGWEDAFRIMAKHGDDRLLDESVVHSGWDQDEWEW